MSLPIQIDKRSGIPIYIQLAERIRLLVHKGVLKPGEPLPTVRALAVHLGINANTVARVYRQLQDESVLRLERGVGTFVAQSGISELPRQDLARLENQVLHVIRLAKEIGMRAVELAQFIETRWQEVDDVQQR